MISKAEVDLLIGVLNSILAMLEGIDPNLAQNKIVMDIQSAIKSLQAIGL
jgi:hypothetical protein